MTSRWSESAARILPLAWPVFVGQLSVIAFSTVDTLLIGRLSARELAALSVGGACHVTVFIGLMGIVMALSPIAGQLHGAQRPVEAGRQLHQAVWLALALASLGALLMSFPGPLIRLLGLPPELEPRVTAFLRVQALALPASLLFTAFRAFSNAVSRPKAVMALQLGGLAVKVPLSALLIHGVPGAGVPPLGVVGCAIATVCAMWAQALAAWWLLRRDAFYAPYALWGHGLHRPEPRALAALLRLGLPMGLGILIEVSGFALMAIFIARFGTTAVAGHQIAANLVSVLFMLPLALANATGTLVAQRVGAGDRVDAQRLGWHGVQLAMALAALVGGAVFLARGPVVDLYTHDAAVAAAALSLLAWVAVFHTLDAAQTLAAFVLRAYRVATVPMLIFAASMWGVGLGGGYLLAFDPAGLAPAALRGASGYWAASTTGLAVAALALNGFLAWMLRRRLRAAPA